MLAALALLLPAALAGGGDPCECSTRIQPSLSSATQDPTTGRITAQYEGLVSLPPAWSAACLVWIDGEWDSTLRPAELRETFLGDARGRSPSHAVQCDGVSPSLLDSAAVVVTLAVYPSCSDYDIFAEDNGFCSTFAA